MTTKTKTPTRHFLRHQREREQREASAREIHDLREQLNTAKSEAVNLGKRHTDEAIRGNRLENHCLVLEAECNGMQKEARRRSRLLWALLAIYLSVLGCLTYGIISLRSRHEGVTRDAADAIAIAAQYRAMYEQAAAQLAADQWSDTLPTPHQRLTIITEGYIDSLGTWRTFDGGEPVNVKYWKPQ